MAASFHPERVVTAPFINPYLQTLDRMQRAPLRPGQLTDRVRALLAERCGRSDRSTEAAFAHGAVGLLSGHTHYFDGFAMLMSFEQGTAVALRPTAAPRSTHECELSVDRKQVQDGYPMIVTLEHQQVICRRTKPQDPQLAYLFE